MTFDTKPSTFRGTFIYIVALSISTVGLNCKSVQSPTREEMELKSIYLDQFKLTYFRQILIKSYNNSECVQEIINSDHSGFTEAILTEDDNKMIGSLTTADSQRIKKDSTHRIGRVAEGAEGKHPLEFMLDRLQSKWLDSIANERYKTSEIELHNQ